MFWQQESVNALKQKLSELRLVSDAIIDMFVLYLSW